MAKNKSNFNFSDFLKELTDGSSAVGPREVEIKKERLYFLIVTEGEKTEPLYFDSFKKKLPKEFLDTIKLIGEGANTTTVVKKAIAEREKRSNNSLLPDFDEVWAVFDRDDFPADRVNNAIILANNESINLGFSNQAFELWYILHFDYLDANLHRSQYIDRLSKIMGFKYKKNSEEVVEFIEKNGDVEQAIIRAKTLCDIFQNEYNHANAPLTTVYKLVEKLIDYCK